MDVSGRYIVLDSAAFASQRFPSNSAFRFRNMLLPPIDNADFDLEVAVLHLLIKGRETGFGTAYNLSCDIIEPYQRGETTCQTLATMLLRRRTGMSTELAQNIYEFAQPRYYQLR